ADGLAAVARAGDRLDPEGAELELAGLDDAVDAKLLRPLDAPLGAAARESVRGASVRDLRGRVRSGHDLRLGQVRDPADVVVVRVRDGEERAAAPNLADDRRDLVGCDRRIAEERVAAGDRQ